MSTIEDRMRELKAECEDCPGPVTYCSDCTVEQEYRRLFCERNTGQPV